MTFLSIHDAPPTLDREGGTFKYSRAFKEMVDSCLVKEPSKRCDLLITSAKSRLINV